VANRRDNLYGVEDKGKVMVNALAVIVLAAGQGTRMKSNLPKVLHPVAGRAMLGHVLTASAAIDPQFILGVVAPGASAIEDAFSPHRVVVQPVARGTGDAVRWAVQSLPDHVTQAVIVFGDTPLVTAESLKNLCDRLNADDRPAVVVFGMDLDDPAAYGRIVRDNDGAVSAIVEFAEATPAQRAITLCNSGFMALDLNRCRAWLADLKNDNSKGEYYLTDLVAMARADGQGVAVVIGAPEDSLGVNDRRDLAAAEAIMQKRLRDQFLRQGVTMIDPSTVFLSFDTVIEPDVRIEPNVYCGPGVHIAVGAEVKAFSHLEGVEIGAGAVVGPFARLRPKTTLGAGAKIGNFVELKNVLVSEGAKISHLSYIGDAVIGAMSNIGAGTITCNYDGYDKFKTVIGAGAFVGSNSSLVAPVSIGDGAIVGAGSVITRDVGTGDLAVAREKQITKSGWARLFHQKKQQKTG